jgi:hypothetical protein
LGNQSRARSSLFFGITWLEYYLIYMFLAEFNLLMSSSCTV